MRGRKPLPTNVKIFRGNPGRRPLNDNEPQPGRKAPPCPRILVGEERKAWRYLVRELGAMGTLASSDRADMMAYCHFWGVAIDAKQQLIEQRAAISGKDPKVIPTKSGNFIQNPWLGIANVAMRELVSISSRMGLEPSERSRLKTGNAKEIESPLSKYLIRA